MTNFSQLMRKEAYENQIYLPKIGTTTLYFHLTTENNIKLKS